LECKSIVWRRHALERMLERGISRAAIKQVILNANVIEIYDNDQPFPSQLLYAMVNRVPLHVVVAYDGTAKECYVVTAYSPTLEHFEDDFITRKKQ